MIEDLPVAVAKCKRLEKEGSEHWRQAMRSFAEAKTAVVQFIVANGPRLKEIRLRAGVPQKFMAFSARVKQPYVSHIESGDCREMSLAAMLRLLEVYLRL